MGYNGRFLSHGGIPVVIHGYMMMTLFFFRGGGTLFSDQFYIIGVIDSHPYPTFSEEHEDSLPSPPGAFVLQYFLWVGPNLHVPEWV